MQVSIEELASRLHVLASEHNTAIMMVGVDM
jgi:hypothetical protein